MRKVDCPYCKNPSDYVGGKEVYPHRKDLYEKRFYLCKQCNAYVGCHGNGPEPLGRLANKELRSLKQAAHAAFDPLWKTNKYSRRNAYSWLADRLGIQVDKCHIGMFNEQQCASVVEICHDLEGEL